MPDQKDSTPDADEVRTGMQTAVERIRKKFSEGVAPKPEPEGEAQSVEENPG